MSVGGARPRGLIARLRHSIGRRLPAAVRAPGAALLNRLEARRGAAYEVAGRRLRFAAGSAPTVVHSAADERARLDALQLAAFSNAIHPGDIVADVGAYRGTYTLVAAACVGTRGHVFAFEPTAANTGHILRNLELNHLQELVTIEPVAVSEHSGSADFFAWGDATTNSLAPGHPEAQRTTVRTISLDEYFAGGALPRVLKLDIEGGEVAALRGAQAILRSPAFIICELHPYAWGAAGHSADELRALLEQNGRYPADLVTGEEILEYRYGAVLLRKRS